MMRSASERTACTAVKALFDDSGDTALQDWVPDGFWTLHTRPADFDAGLRNPFLRHGNNLEAYNGNDARGGCRCRAGS